MKRRSLPLTMFLNISQQISSSEEMNTQVDRSFQELSEYIITILKKLITVQIKISKTHEKRTKNGVRRSLRARVSSLYSKHFQEIHASQDLSTQGNREFWALLEYLITFLKMQFYIAAIILQMQTLRNYLLEFQGIIFCSGDPPFPKEKIVFQMSRFF